MSAKSKIKLLNATELIAQRKLADEIDGEFLTRGVKATFPTNTEQERTIIKSYQGECSSLKTLLKSFFSENY